MGYLYLIANSLSALQVILNQMGIADTRLNKGDKFNDPFAYYK